MLDLMILTICFLALLIASITDLKTREVPDWLNFSLIASGLGINLIFSIVKSDWSYIIYSIAGFVFCIIIGVLMFYTGQWGGGDSKTLMGVGALVGLNIQNYKNLFLLFSDNFLISLLVNILFVGAIYGIIWILVLGLRNRKNISKKLKDVVKQKSYRISIFIFAFTMLILILMIAFVPYVELKISLVFLLVFTVILLFLWTFAKAVEETAMIKLVPVEKLTEGDWIVEDVIVNKKRITGPKDLGITKEQIQALLKLKKRGKIKNVKIKEGIPFVPSFLIGFIITFFYGNLIFTITLFF